MIISRVSIGQTKKNWNSIQVKKFPAKHLLHFRMWFKKGAATLFSSPFCPTNN
jgi:hypothetical protein